MARHMLLISSNNRIDRDGEIVTEKALADYVRRSHDKTGNYIGNNDLLWWHGGEPIGKIIECDLVYGFLVEIAEELPNAVVTVGKAENQERVAIADIWNMVQKAPNLFAVSQGGYGVTDGTDNTVLSAIVKRESSLLPAQNPANLFTGAWVFGG